MPVRFQCPKCLSHLTVSRKFAGRRGLCPNCKTKIQVPEISIGDPLDESSGEYSDKADSDTLQDYDREVASVSDAAQSNDDPDRAGSSGGRIRGRRSNSASMSTSLNSHVPIARWIVYLQAALLGLTATTFFIFGMAVGNTTGGSVSDSADGNCVVSGAVYYDRGQERVADYGAVVILLPVDSKPRTRPEAAGLQPEQFKPVRNEAIEQIRSMGGRVVRADKDGKFQTELQNNRSYWWLVISRNKPADNDMIGKQTRAELGTYFLPIEDLLGDRDFMWHRVRISGSNQQMQDVAF